MSEKKMGIVMRIFTVDQWFILPMLALIGILTMRAAYANSPSAPEPDGLTLMPVPAELTPGEGLLTVDSTFRIALVGYSEPRLERAARRTAGCLSRQTGLPLASQILQEGQSALLLIRCDGPAGAVQQAVEDESYELTVTPQQAVLHAPKPYGVLRGLETFLQLVETTPRGFALRCVTIRDMPRFPWRGLLIDVCRHWIPMDLLKRTLDGMAAVKMNVLHWHLTEDQAFRIESKRYPALHRKGSGGLFFSQAQVKEIIAYARDRGIRVVPEFDMPGHTTSWFVGHPELASAPGPYALAREWGVHDAAMDPTREEVYRFIDRFIGEMARLFPDSYLHIGGDEVTGKDWDANPRIQEFKRTHRFTTNKDLQSYFNRRLVTLLRKHGKKMVGWDEILHPDLPKDIVVQSWHGQRSLAESVKKGYAGILSSGYYLDHMRPAAFHYAVDPYDTMVTALSPEEQKRILGGEACMWTEFVAPENIESRLWPRAAAIAERLWSPSGVRNPEDMYRRLDIVSQRIEWLGIMHRWNTRLMMQRLAGYRPLQPVKELVEVVEPVKLYERGHARKYTTETPLNRLVDAAWPESYRAREFKGFVTELLGDSSRNRRGEEIHNWLTVWAGNHEKLKLYFPVSFLLQEAQPLSSDLSQVASIGLTALDALRSRHVLPAEESKRMMDLLEQAAKPRAEVLLMIVHPVRMLVDAASAHTPD
jgi:hexosaminidase